MAMAENRKGSMAPTKRQAMTLGFEMLIVSIPATPM